MSSVEMQLAIDRLKVELAKSALDEGPDKNEMRHKVVELQMRLRKRRDEEEEMVSGDNNCPYWCALLAAILYLIPWFNFR